MLRATLAIVLVQTTFFCFSGKAQTVSLRGTVRDSKTRDPLPSANIRILGTSRGTVTNVDGRYSLTLEKGRYTLSYRYVGYQSESLTIVIVADSIRDVYLTPSPVIMHEVVVSSEDPAVEIIRQAIAHKHEWMDKLKSYRFDAFTRQTLRRDSAIAGIAESYTTGYQSVGKPMHEIVEQRRQTQNIPLGENFAAVRRIVNFNDDRVNLFSIRVNEAKSDYRFVGPTAEDALDNYDYKLLKTSSSSGVEAYTIQMTPKSRTRPLFKGTITIANETFAVMGVDLEPNEAFIIPFISNADLHYRQQFGLYDSLFWMPTNIRVSGSFTLNLIGLSIPRFGMEFSSSIYDYEINVPIPDTIEQKQEVSVDTANARYDSTYWANHEVLPLTGEEQTAYKTLDTVQTLEKQFKPTGPLASLGNKNTGSILDNCDFRFNRVEGFYLGVKFDQDSLPGDFSLAGSAGYGFSDNDAKYSLASTWHALDRGRLGVGAEIYRTMDNIPDQGYYGPLAISLMALLNQEDYRDYFLSNGWRVFSTFEPAKSFSGELGFITERQQSRIVKSSYSLFNSSTVFRPNPAIEEGKLHALTLALHYGDPPEVFDFVSTNAVDVAVEHTSPSLASSDFNYTRYSGILTLSTPTFGRDLLFGPLMRIRVTAGTSSGALPPQQLFLPDSRASGYAPFGVLKAGELKEFAGDKMVMVNVEHNFRSVPFLALNIPYFYRNSIELVAFGSAAQTWYGGSSSSQGWYYEAGFGFSRILQVLRIDLSYRFREPRRFFLTASVAQLL